MHKPKSAAVLFKSRAPQSPNKALSVASTSKKSPFKQRKAAKKASKGRRDARNLSWKAFDGRRPRPVREARAQDLQLTIPRWPKAELRSVDIPTRRPTQDAISGPETSQQSSQPASEGPKPLPMAKGRGHDRKGPKPRRFGLVRAAPPAPEGPVASSAQAESATGALVRAQNRLSPGPLRGQGRGQSAKRPREDGPLSPFRTSPPAEPSPLRVLQ